MTKNVISPGKSEIFSDELENFCDRIQDPQTSNQIDAADNMYTFSTSSFVRK